MPRRTTAPLGAPCWVDLLSSDTQRSREFYGHLFGWTAEDPVEEYGGYFSFAKDGVQVAGCMARQPEIHPPDMWSVYLATADAAKTLDLATANGGSVLVPAMAVGDLGTMAVLTDAGGAGIGLWQPDQYQGFEVFGEPGTPGWFEVYTRDYDATVTFYRTVFGWDAQSVSDTADFRYTVMRDGEAMYAGIMDGSAMLPSQVSAHWAVYFGVADTDAALANVVDLGGSVVLPAEDTPYGRLAGAADPTGAQFKLIGPNEAMPAST